MGHWKTWQRKTVGEKFCDLLIGSFLLYCVGAIVAWLSIVVIFLCIGEFASAFIALVGPPFVIGAIIGVGQEWQS